jgi:uncharacterized membrane protein YdjX (TVP38/TMEM64 family)
LKFKHSIVIITIICIFATALGIYLLGGVDRQQLQTSLERLGIWAPIIYILLYTIGTILILPSTPLNLSGGAIFGIWWGTLWTTVAALIAAVVAFYYSRTIGRDWIAAKFKGAIAVIDAEMQQGGLFYLFAIRLLPIIPYGIVNFAAGLTSISFRDYFLGTIVGTLPGILPFVMMGSGLKAMTQGDIFPLMCALALTGMLVAGATWYRRHRQSPVEDLTRVEQIQKNRRSHL